MSKSKIIHNIGRENQNFDFRVVRFVDENPDKTVYIIDGELNCRYHIMEIWYGDNNEIVAYTSPEELAASTIDDLKYYLEEYREAFEQPVLNYEFIKDQVRRVKIKFNREWKKLTSEEKVDRCRSVSRVDQDDDRPTLLKWEDYIKDYVPPVYERISKQEAIERFKLKER